jgi:hypothetical protein
MSGTFLVFVVHLESLLKHKPVPPIVLPNQEGRKLG